MYMCVYLHTSTIREHMIFMESCEELYSQKEMGYRVANLALWSWSENSGELEQQLY